MRAILGGLLVLVLCGCPPCLPDDEGPDPGFVPPATILAEIVDDNGKRLDSNAHAYCSIASLNLVSRYDETTGIHQLHPVPQGQWEVQATAEGYPTVSALVVITDGSVVHLRYWLVDSDPVVEVGSDTARVLPVCGEDGRIVYALVGLLVLVRRRMRKA